MQDLTVVQMIPGSPAHGFRSKPSSRCEGVVQYDGLSRATIYDDSLHMQQLLRGHSLGFASQLPKLPMTIYFLRPYCLPSSIGRCRRMECSGDTVHGPGAFAP